jgi:hypothetical protein
MEGAQAIHPHRAATELTVLPRPPRPFHDVTQGPHPPIAGRHRGTVKQRPQRPGPRPLPGLGDR